jgi:hypothetical protein
MSADIRSRKKGGYEEVPEFFKRREADGSIVLCHNCHKAADNNRPIIPCSLCNTYWHLDCCDPPMAHPPILRTWVCPLHVDDLLSEVPVGLAPAHKHRKIKGAPAIVPAYSRGIPNNGFIEVELEDPRDDSGWEDVKAFGRIYRLPEKGVILDFISQ